MSTQPDRIAALEARLDELERARPAPMPRRGLGTVQVCNTPSGPMRPMRRLAILVLAAALLVPVGAVLASHQFSDVPTSHKFHNSIDAIADAGITTGCGGGKFCPDGLVTRGQMAAFLNRLGALGPGTTPKVNADRLDGLHANQMVRAASYWTGDTTAIPSGSQTQYGGSFSITAPVDGFVLIQVNVTYQNVACGTGCVASVWVQGEDGIAASYGLTSIPLNGGVASASVAGVVPVEAGAHEYEVWLSRSTGDGAIYGYWGNGTALFVPFGPTGGTTALSAPKVAAAPLK